jgi:hypothetical protein
VYSWFKCRKSRFTDISGSIHILSVSSLPFHSFLSDVGSGFITIYEHILISTHWWEPGTLLSFASRSLFVLKQYIILAFNCDIQ